MIKMTTANERSYDCFLLTVKLTCSHLLFSSVLCRYFSDCVRPYGPEIGVVDITCRMNIQLRSPPLEDAADILKGLQARGMTSIMSGLDNLRNMVGSPIAGTDMYSS
jgi:ferredoxin-nitrite reductase